MRNDWTHGRSTNVQQHHVDVNEIFIVHVCILPTSDIRNETIERICEIRMQLAKNIDEWLIIRRAAISGSDQCNEKLGHQRTIFAHCGWHPKLVEHHRGHGGIFDINYQLPEMIWHMTNHGLCILQICSDHRGQAIQIKFPIHWGREHACFLDMV